MSISLVLIFFWGVECVNRVFTYFITTFLRDLHFYCPFFQFALGGITVYNYIKNLEDMNDIGIFLKRWIGVNADRPKVKKSN